MTRDANRLRHLTSCCALILLFYATSISRAETHQVELIRQRVAANEAAVKALDAKLALGVWRLEQLRGLKEAGHATWLEVARAEVVVERLRAKAEGARKFSSLLQAAREHLNTEAAQPISREDWLPNVKLTLPGSVRLLAWFDPTRHSAKSASAYVAALKAESEMLIESATEALDSAGRKSEATQARLGRLSKLAKGNPTELKRAQLKCDVAEAELELARALFALQQNEDARCVRLQQILQEAANNSADEAFDAADSSRNGTVRLVHDFPSALFEANLRVAEGEAGAQGELAAAKLLLERAQLRLDAVETLKQQGFARTVEVADAKRDLEGAKQLVVSLENSKKLLADSFAQLRAAQPRQKAEVKLASYNAVTAAGATLERFPVSVPAVLHLIELRQQQIEAAADQRSLRADVTMREALYRKLLKLNRSDKPGKRELRFARIDIEFLKGRILAAKERQEIVALEERRFVLQVTQQVQQARENGGTKVNMASYVEPWSIQNVVGSRRLLGQDPCPELHCDELLGCLAEFYLPSSRSMIDIIESDVELRRTLPHEVRRVGRYESPVRLDTDIFGSHPAVIPVSRGCCSLYALASGARHCGVLCGGDSENVFYTPYDVGLSNMNFWAAESCLSSPLGSVGRHACCAGDAMFARRTIFNTNYSACYAFGIRKGNVNSGWQRRSSPYGGPWYLPGSPTNYR